LVLALGQWAACAQGVPAGLLADGIPPVPAALRTGAAPYLALGGSSFRGWHPERREMLVTTRVGEVTQLHALAQPKGKRVPLTRLSEPVNYGWYQPGEGKLLVVQTDTGGNENYQFHCLEPGAAAAAGATPVLLTDGQARNTSPRWSHGGRWLAYASTRRNGRDNDIYVVDPRDPRTTRCVLTTTSPSWSVADWSRDDARLLLRRGISDKQTELWSLDVVTGVKTLLTRPGEKVYAAGPRCGDGDTAVYAATDDQGDFLTLTRLDLATGRREPLAAHVPWDVEGFDLSPDGRTLAFVANEDGFSRLHLLDLATRRELPVPKLPGDLLSGLTWHPRRRELGFTLNGAQSASSAWSLAADTGELTRWTDRARDPAVGAAFAEPELVKLQSFDGVGVTALVYRPDAGRFPGPRPVLLLIHGGPAGQSRPGFRGADNYFLNELGLALVYPNVRGSTGYGRQYLTLDNGLRREDAVRDIGTVLDWIRRDAALDARRVGVMGASYGGFMTLACLVRYPEVFRCGIDCVGIANFVSFLRDTSDYRRDERRDEYGDERRPEVRAFLERISPLTNADQIRAPLCIVHGKNDPRVPVSEAEAMRDAIRRRGGAVWYLLAEDEGHGFRRKANLDYQFHATVLFLQEHLLR
jgi:dipeptidyl aminopeptidase/acylaminoacyl peptidase